MLPVGKSEIAKYLQDSVFYETIESNGTFELSEEHYKEEIIINSFEDLIIYIRILDFWLVNKIPDEFYDWVFKNKDKINMDVLNEHFTSNHLIDEIQVIITSTDENICENITKEGSVNLLIYAHENGCKWSTSLSLTAANYGHLECLKYTHEKGCEWNSLICYNAAENGHIECLKYAHENGCKLTSSIFFITTKNGHFDCLKYAYENGCQWNQYICATAAKYRRFEYLKYVFENGCEMYQDTCYYAAQSGDLQCLKYALENGCELDETICELVSNDLDCSKYIQEVKEKYY